jgi:hypothetical protein
VLDPTECQIEMVDAKRGPCGGVDANKSIEGV